MSTYKDISNTLRYGVFDFFRDVSFNREGFLVLLLCIILFDVWSDYCSQAMGLWPYRLTDLVESAIFFHYMIEFL